jgi:hypothetical protein
MMAAWVQALIGVAGETITYQRVTHGSYSTATLQSTPSVQSYTIKAGVREYRAREVSGLVQQGAREVRIAAADLSFSPKPNDQVVIGGKVRRRCTSCRSGAGMGHRLEGDADRAEGGTAWNPLRLYEPRSQNAVVVE